MTHKTDTTVLYPARHHTFKYVEKDVQLTEVGPRFDMKCE